MQEPVWQNPSIAFLRHSTRCVFASETNDLDDDDAVLRARRKLALESKVSAGRGIL
jgi:hypothetical protein